MSRQSLGSSLQFIGAAIALICLVLGFASFDTHPVTPPRAQRVNCVNNLKQIGLAFKTWAIDNNDQFPFNVGTNAGGTRELCSLADNGFDKNAYLHFRVMSNELSVPLILVCPKDHSRKAARDFSSLRPENVSYLLHSGTNFTDGNPSANLAVCSVHGNILHCDGSVTVVKIDHDWRDIEIIDIIYSDPELANHLVLSVSGFLIGVLMVLIGARMKRNLGPSHAS